MPLLELPSQPFSDLYRAVRFNTMATQRTVDAQSPINLSQLQSEASNGTYTFTRPLTILNCATQDKYVVYASCPHCLNGMHPENNDCFCPIHQWQPVPVYRFALRILLSDWLGGECWATVFNETAAEVLGFSADTYVSMTTLEKRYASLSPLRGARVMVTIKKRVKDAYVNYTVSKLEVIDANIE